MKVKFLVSLFRGICNKFRENEKLNSLLFFSLLYEIICNILNMHGIQSNIMIIFCCHLIPDLHLLLTHYSFY